jgi:hypothetical protein
MPALEGSASSVAMNANTKGWKRRIKRSQKLNFFSEVMRMTDSTYRKMKLV